MIWLQFNSSLRTSDEYRYVFMYRRKGELGETIKFITTNRFYQYNIESERKNILLTTKEN